MLIKFKKGYIIIKDRNFKKTDFLKKLNSKKHSFSYKIFTQMYDYLFEKTIILHDDYKNYYSDEFNTFSLYLKKKYRMPNKIINKIEKYKVNNIILYDPGPKHGFSTTLEIILSEEWLPIFNKLLEHQNEN